ncbi:hypothetical protein Cylst_0199 [Cylindrospermum stagnale PCC 7417]|uniref:RiboL-PSP-HEPN domain-containing protein n=1 Tax=Cylindrospermum stagnale PCC 7417 TaxID=56107 RepID=K9WS22_9NOST|nr:hypothetical protein [Cylindrospermum stagnale]AFZ22574.1 hypothetical protein Cylst_0199 [Cylindrospermum stagnale PCC 7417]
MKKNNKINKYSGRIRNKKAKLTLLELIDGREEKIESILLNEMEYFIDNAILFNSLDDVTSFLNLLHISVQEDGEKLKKQDLDNINLLIQKRHSIAHKADCSNLEPDQIKIWGKSLLNFFRYIAQIFGVKIGVDEN